MNRGTVYEEKETDVAIACEVLSHAVKDSLDVAMIVSGDSDFVPLVKTYQDLFPDKKILFAFPYGRTSKQLRKLCPDSLRSQKKPTNATISQSV